MKNPDIGKIIEGEQHRDAIHVAVAPVVAAHLLIPGRHVALNEKGEASEHTSNKPIGIIDPFLTTHVEAGRQCWLFLYPGTITALRHEWTHPAFNTVDPKEESKQWLMAIAERCGVSYGRMIEAVDSDDYIHMGDNEQYKDVLDGCLEDFQRHCSIVLGKPVSNAYPFSCSC